MLRTNQLNLSAHRYDRAEFQRLLNDPNFICVCSSCADRFGEYGIVGFASIQRVEERLMLVDYVMSCRVAQKKVENAWFRWALETTAAAGYSRLYANYVKTSRNHVLLTALHDVGFAAVDERVGGTLLELDSARPIPDSDLVTLVADTAQWLELSHWNARVATGARS